jgi:hypothetical protein
VPERQHTPTEQLIDVIDRLTSVHAVFSQVEDGPRHKQFHEGLIQQLRAAVVSDIGVAGGGGARSSSPTPFDEDAWQKYAAIERAIQERLTWMPGLYPEQDLIAWRAWFLAQNTTTEQAIRNELQTFRGWEWMILDKFDPPRRKELLEDCPMCHQTWWVDNRDRENLQRKVCLVVTWRPGDVDRVTAECTYCRAVGDDRAHWDGENGLLELRWDLDHGVQYDADDTRGTTSDTTSPEGTS